MIDLLFVSGVDQGGSYMSTLRLASALGERGHRIAMVHERSDRPVITRVSRRLNNLEVKLADHPPGGAARWVARRIGRRIEPQAAASFELSRAAVIENAAPALLDRHPSAVVVSSVSRVAWRRLHADARARRVPVVLYLREEFLLGHLALGVNPDAVFANSESLAAGARAAGFDPALVPSIVDVSESQVDSTRRAVLVVNPTAHYGIDVVVPLAEANPDVPFVLQESAQLMPAERQRVEQVTRRLSNVELRSFAPNPRDVFRDARLLLAPYTDALASNRPRVVLEAQANGIPVLGATTAGLVETVGPGGVLLDLGAGIEAWSTVLREIWDDAHRYVALSAAAREHAARPDVDPDHIVDMFERTVTGMFGGRADRRT